MKIHTKNGDKQTMETIYMNKNELSLLLNNKPEQIQNFINEFEMNIKLREKGLLSLDGMFRFLNKSRKKNKQTEFLSRFTRYVIIRKF